MLDSGYCGDRYVVKIMTCFYQLSYPNGRSMLRKNAVSKWPVDDATQECCKDLDLFLSTACRSMLCKHVATVFFFFFLIKGLFFFSERGGNRLASLVN